MANKYENKEIQSKKLAETPSKKLDDDLRRVEIAQLRLLMLKRPNETKKVFNELFPKTV